MKEDKGTKEHCVLVLAERSLLLAATIHRRGLYSLRCAFRSRDLFIP